MEEYWWRWRITKTKRRKLRAEERKRSREVMKRYYANLAKLKVPKEEFPPFQPVLYGPDGLLYAKEDIDDQYHEWKDKRDEYYGWGMYDSDWE